MLSPGLSRDEHPPRPLGPAAPRDDPSSSRTPSPEASRAPVQQAYGSSSLYRRGDAASRPGPPRDAPAGAGQGRGCRGPPRAGGREMLMIKLYIPEPRGAERPAGSVSCPGKWRRRGQEQLRRSQALPEV